MSPGNDRPARLLLVEDNPSDVVLFRHALEENKLACELETAGDGGTAMGLVERFASGESAPPDVLVLDINLPRDNGLEVLAKLRSIPNLTSVSVVVLTSSTSSRERQRAEALGIEAYFQKPTDLEAYIDIGARVKGLLDRRKS